MGPGDLETLTRSLRGLAGADERVLVGPENSDDAGVYLLDDARALVATADFITPVADDAHRFGRVAAANALSDVYAMGGRVLFALNLCAFPTPGEAVPVEELTKILEGAAETVAAAGGVVLGGHTVADPELKFGLAVVGEADPARLLTNAAARPGDRLVLTKPLGTGVLINAFKADELSAEGLEPAMVEMERLNRVASELALEHGAHAATDITGFGLVGHGLEVARASRVVLRVRFHALPVYEGFYRLAERGVTTGSTSKNRSASEGSWSTRRELSEGEIRLLFDPQTSGPLLLSVPSETVEPLVAALVASGHTAAEVGEVAAPETGEDGGRVEIV